MRHEFVDTPVEVSFRNLDKDEYWEERVQIYEDFQASKKIYKDMTHLEREIIADRVRVILEAMHDNVEGWLPAAFTLSDGDCINVTMKILKTKIESDISDRERVTSFRLNEAAKDMQQIILELDDEVEAQEKETDTN